MNLENDFFQKYEQITTIKPIPGALSLAKNGAFYWLNYAGMGETDYHELSKNEQGIVKKLVKTNELNITGDTYVIPIHGDDHLIGEIKFKIISK